MADLHLRLVKWKLGVAVVGFIMVLSFGGFDALGSRLGKKRATKVVVGVAVLGVLLGWRAWGRRRREEQQSRVRARYAGRPKLERKPAQRTVAAEQEPAPAPLSVRPARTSPRAAAAGDLYDKAKYHFDSVAEHGLDSRQAYVHSAFFLAWLIENRLVSRQFLESAPDVVDRVRARAGDVVAIHEDGDGVLASDMLGDDGNRFARAYFSFDGEDPDTYIADYVAVLAHGLPSVFHVEGTWETYERLRRRLDARFNLWQITGEVGPLS